MSPRQRPPAAIDEDETRRRIAEGMRGPLTVLPSRAGETLDERADALARAREIMPSDTDPDDLVGVAEWLASGHPGLLLALNDQTARNHTRTGQRLGGAEEWREGPDAATWSPDAPAADLEPAPTVHMHFWDTTSRAAPEVGDRLVGDDGAVVVTAVDEHPTEPDVTRVTLRDASADDDPADDPDAAGLCGHTPGPLDVVQAPAVLTTAPPAPRICCRLVEHTGRHRAGDGAEW